MNSKEKAWKLPPGWVWKVVLGQSNDLEWVAFCTFPMAANFQIGVTFKPVGKEEAFIRQLVCLRNQYDHPTSPFDFRAAEIQRRMNEGPKMMNLEWDSNIRRFCFEDQPMAGEWYPGWFNITTNPADDPDADPEQDQ